MTTDFECPICHEHATITSDMIGQFMPCPACGQTVAVDPPAQRSRRSPARSQELVRHCKVAFRVFRGAWSSWETLFQEAAEFASSLPPAKLISISHSEDQNDGVVTVWYWTK